MKKRVLGTICMIVIAVQMLLLGAGVRKLPSAPKGLKEKDGILAVGRVVKKESRCDYQILYVKDTTVRYRNQSDSKLNIIVYDKTFSSVSLGNVIRIEGKSFLFEKPRNPGNFNQKFYYEKQGLSFGVFTDEIQVIRKDLWKIRDRLSKFRERWQRNLILVLGEKDGGMLSAMMLGEKSGLDEAQKELFSGSGIAHTLALSGLHLSFVGLLFYQSLRKIGISYGKAGVVGIVFLVLYAVMTGMSVSTKRALIMFVIRVGADVSGRVYDMMTSLLVAAAIVLCENPYMMFDAGFQLSFGAILGILLFLPFLRGMFSKKETGRGQKLLEGALTSLAIQLFLLPITMYFFFEIPLYSVLLNIVVIPLMSVVLALGFAGSFLGLFSVGFGEILLLGCSLIFRLYDFLCECSMKLPFARVVTGKPKWQQVVVCYCLLLIFLWVVGKKHENREGLKNMRAKCGALVCVLLIFSVSALQRWNAGEFLVIMLDVGQGDGIYMRGPYGKHYLIDGGSSDEKKVGKYRIEPFLKSQGVGTLDYVFVSHGDGDHISGVEELLERQALGITIKTLVLPAQEVWDENLYALAQKAEDCGTKVAVIGMKDVLRESSRFGKETLEFLCLKPEVLENSLDGNANSMVLKAKYGEFEILFTGDVEGEGEERLLKDEEIERIDVLKVAHHGSKNSTTEEMLTMTKPKIGLISAGRGNTYGHPHEETIRRLKANGVKIYNTQDKGAICIKTDGRKVEIESVFE